MAKAKSAKVAPVKRSLKVVDSVPNEQGRFEVVFENASDAIVVVDLRTGTITNANTAALDLTGYLGTELIGSPVELLSPKPAELPHHSNGIVHAHIENSGFFEDLVLVSKDRYPRFVSMSVRTITLEGKPSAICIIRDVGEKKNMERDLITKHTELRNAYVDLEKANAELRAMQETLVQSGKLAALGELAAGIAHELNQPLTVIKGFAQEAVATIDSTKSVVDVRDQLQEILGASEKMQKIISHLRNFTRKTTEDFQWVNVHSVIEESLLMLDKQLKSRGIRVERNFDSTLAQVYCNPFQLEQVFINLATNARDAIEAKRSGSGLISIRTHMESPGMVGVEFVDDGVGIADATKGKIFNPFFTTKEVGKGMGLGLSISYGILNRIHASILVESAVGKGTKFTIKLPVDYRKH